MDFRHLIVTCLFSKLRLPFDNQKVKENYAIFPKNISIFSGKFVQKISVRTVGRKGFPAPSGNENFIFSSHSKQEW